MSIPASKIKFIKSLHRKKYRQKYNNFIVEGDKIAKEMLHSNSLRIEGIYATDSWLSTNKALLKLHESVLFKVSLTELGRISTLKTPNQVLIVAKIPQRNFPNQHTGFALYLDNIQDPGNMGTILRIADWYGIKTIFASPDTVELYNPKVLQGSMGAFLRINVFSTGLQTVREAFPDKVIYGAFMEGESIYNIQKHPDALLVIGNEGNGIHPDNIPLVDKIITIPKGKDGGAESLNAGVATGIICSEFFRENP